MTPLEFLADLRLIFNTASAGLNLAKDALFFKIDKNIADVEIEVADDPNIFDASIMALNQTHVLKIQKIAQESLRVLEHPRWRDPDKEAEIRRLANEALFHLGYFEDVFNASGIDFKTYKAYFERNKTI